MAKSNKFHPPNTISRDHKARLLKVFTKGPVKASKKKQWKNAVCSVCLEFPHNAVRLLCSSYGKGCWPYMCATGHRFSNCLEQYEKAYTNTRSSSDITLSEKSGLPEEKSEMRELLCPLCRGEVKGWAVEDPARKYFNSKKRTCMHDDCSYVGNYKQLKKHEKLVHSRAPCPRDVDPTHLEKWKKLENERERDDVFSTIRSTMPGTVVMGDYVVDENYDSDYFSEDEFLSLPAYARHGTQLGYIVDYDSYEDDEMEELRARGVSRRHATRNARSGTRLLVHRRVGRPRLRR